MSRPIYSPPKPSVYSKDTIIDLTNCSGFMIENLGITEFLVGEEGQEVIPFELKSSREFECPEGGVYKGDYSLKFTGGTGKALVIRNQPSAILTEESKTAKVRQKAVKKDGKSEGTQISYIETKV